MTTLDRVTAIANQCTKAGYPPSLVTAITQYLSGQGALSQVQHEWQLALQQKFSPHAWPLMLLSQFADDHLDEVDWRILDILMRNGDVTMFLYRLAHSGPLEQVRDYLVNHGVDEAKILTILLSHPYYFISQSGKPSAAGHLILSYIPHRFNDLLKLTPHNNYPQFIALLLTAQPPYVDLAWQIAQQLPPHTPGHFVVNLLRADPVRFTAWARRIVGPSSPWLYHTQLPVLRTLIELDPAHHIDLAVQAAQAPVPTRKWDSVELQCVGLEATYRFDPVQYLPLVESAAIAPHPTLGKFAVKLLADADFAQARPIWQRCITEGDIEAASEALALLLKHDWAEREAYMLSLLAHRSK
jgi:hypothetical protein